MNNQAVEQEIQVKGLTAPRITEADVNAVIVGCDYHVFPGSQLTVCCLTLRNGFTVTGESACASPENFDAELGRKIAYGNAHGKVWAFEAYLLKQSLFEASQEGREDARKLKAYWDDKLAEDRSTDGIAAAIESASLNPARHHRGDPE